MELLCFNLVYPLPAWTLGARTVESRIPGELGAKFPSFHGISRLRFDEGRSDWWLAGWTRRPPWADGSKRAEPGETLRSRCQVAVVIKQVLARRGSGKLGTQGA